MADVRQQSDFPIDGILYLEDLEENYLPEVLDSLRVWPRSNGKWN
jgi:hypothetical protein